MIVICSAFFSRFKERVEEWRCINDNLIHKIRSTPNGKPPSFHEQSYRTPPTSITVNSHSRIESFPGSMRPIVLCRGLPFKWNKNTKSAPSPSFGNDHNSAGPSIHAIFQVNRKRRTPKIHKRIFNRLDLLTVFCHESLSSPRLVAASSTVCQQRHTSNIPIHQPRWRYVERSIWVDFRRFDSMWFEFINCCRCVGVSGGFSSIVHHYCAFVNQSRSIYRSLHFFFLLSILSLRFAFRRWKNYLIWLDITATGLISAVWQRYPETTVAFPG